MGAAQRNWKKKLLFSLLAAGVVGSTGIMSANAIDYTGPLTTENINLPAGTWPLGITSKTVTLTGPGVNNSNELITVNGVGASNLLININNSTLNVGSEDTTYKISGIIYLSDSTISVDKGTLEMESLYFLNQEFPINILTGNAKVTREFYGSADILFGGSKAAHVTAENAKEFYGKALLTSNGSSQEESSEGAFKFEDDVIN